MAKKRKSGGRTKGKSGRSKSVQCTKCGRLVPVDKTKKRTRRVSLVDYQLARDLRKQGAYVPTKKITRYYCISCAIHSGKVQIRQESDRKSHLR